MAEPLPEMVPRTVAGQRVAPIPLADGTIPRTRGQAFGATFSFANDFVLDRWKMLGEEGQTITEQEHKDLVGDRPIPFFQGITGRQTERRIAEFDFAQTDAQYSQFPLTQFAAGVIPFFYEPGTLATMPLGGKNIKAIARAPAFSMRQFLTQSGIGSAKIATGSVAVEAAQQVKQTGVLEPVSLAGAGLAPFVLTPAFGALGRGIRAGIGKIKDGPMTARVIDATEGRLSPEQASKVADDVANAPAPRPRILGEDVPTPKRRLAQVFEGFPEGQAEFLRGLSAGREDARAFATRIGLDPDAPALRDLVATMQDRSSQTRSTKPSFNGKVLSQLNRLRKGEATPDDIQTLTDAGLVLPKAKLVDGEVKPTGEVSLSASGRLLDDALQNSKDPANRALINDVVRRGPAALDDAAAQRGVDLDPATNAQASPNRIVAPDTVSDGEVIKALDAAAVKTAGPESDLFGQPGVRGTAPEPRGRAQPDDAGTASRVGAADEVDAERAQLDAGIRRFGGDPEALDSLSARVLEQIRTCGRT